MYDVFILEKPYLKIAKVHPFLFIYLFFSFGANNSPHLNSHLSVLSEYGEFLHSRGERFTDFNEICREIVRETNRLTGSNKGLSAVPMHLKIHSPNGNG